MGSIRSAYPLPSRRRRIAVIGAGASGLTAAKCLLDEGLEPIVFERTAEIGGLWNYHEELADGGGVAYRSLHTNTSRQMMAFSDFPFPGTLPDFPHRGDVLKYLHDYADHGSLRDRIRLNSDVEALSPTSDGQWAVTTRAGETTATEIFDGAAVCSGRDRRPVIPTPPGSEAFRGLKLHSSRYKGPEGFAGKEIVVVGLGSSGADIAVELSQVAHRLVLSTTVGAWLFPKYLGARPWDFQLTRLGGWVPYGIRMRVLRRLVLQEYRRLGYDGWMRACGMPEPEFDVWRARLTPTSELIPLIAGGAIAVRKDIAHIEPEHVVFSDGSREPADVILYCAGYHMQFPFLPDVTVAGDRIDLYKHVFHPDLLNLAFVGMVIVGGPLLPVSEQQARWVARVFSGALKLPTTARMHADISRRRARQARRSPYPMRVQLLEYMDELGTLIGVRPNLLRNPGLIRPLLTGPLLAAQYRLDGPGGWKQAEATIREFRKLQIEKSAPPRAAS